MESEIKNVQFFYAQLKLRAIAALSVVLAELVPYYNTEIFATSTNFHLATCVVEFHLNVHTCQIQGFSNSYAY